MFIAHILLHDHNRTKKSHFIARYVMRAVYECKTPRRYVSRYRTVFSAPRLGSFNCYRNVCHAVGRLRPNSDETKRFVRSETGVGRSCREQCPERKFFNRAFRRIRPEVSERDLGGDNINPLPSLLPSLAPSLPRSLPPIFCQLNVQNNNNGRLKNTRVGNEGWGRGGSENDVNNTVDNRSRQNVYPAAFNMDFG